ncbi:MAG: hypothetical protein ACD_40C00073G0009 [uncultured bacterium]|nr:MAG: hypothetical protein ACD_40C00073G0009 [uncultured bacterium]
MEGQISGFQLEVAINHYFIQHHKKIVWMPFSGLSPNKLHKLGFSRGIVPYFIDLFQFHATQI